MSKISVIIPVYNVEKYLPECLDSVLNQTLKDIEIICIDDGSADKSVDIIKEYKQKDNRIILITQANQGAGAARNNGLRTAKGEFISFMDSDDYYPSINTLQNMYNKAIENKVKICGGSVKHISNKDIKVEDKYTFEQDTIMLYSDYQYDYGYWRFIYDRKFLIENQLYFPDYLRGEDPPFFVRAMILAKKFYALKEETYCYRVSYKQINWTERKISDVIHSYIDCLSLAKEYNLCELKNIQYQRINGRYFISSVYPFFYSEYVTKAINILKNIETENLDDFYYTGKLNKNKKATLENILSIKNSKNKKHKVITFLGFKLKIKRG